MMKMNPNMRRHQKAVFPTSVVLNILSSGFHLTLSSLLPTLFGSLSDASM